MRYLLVFLSLAGLVISTMALRIHYSTALEPCSINDHWDCGIVNRSSFSMIGPIPVAAVGMAGYIVLGILALMRRRILLSGAAIIGLLFALHLTGIERNVLQVWCLYCVISQGIIALITLLSIAWFIAFEMSKRRTQPAA
jgi:vitamin-K-epoxide reductase (warfarin-sensitive)